MTRKRPLVGEIRVLKCRVYPNKAQAAQLKRFARVQTVDAYNAAVRLIEGDRRRASNLTTLRDAVKEKINEDVPSYVHDAGVIHAVHAYKSNKRKQAKDVREMLEAAETSDGG